MMQNVPLLARSLGTRSPRPALRTVGLCAALLGCLAAAGPARAAITGGLTASYTYTPPTINLLLPDLVITNARYLSFQWYVGGIYHYSTVVSATVQNIGQAPAAATQT